MAKTFSPLRRFNILNQAATSKSAGVQAAPVVPQSTGEATGQLVPPGTISPWSRHDDNQLQAMLKACLFGLDDDADPQVTRSLAMSIPTIAKCRHTLFALASRLPIEVFDSELQRVEPQPAIARFPERGRPRSQTIGWMCDQMLFYGRAWLVATEWASETDGARARRFELIPETLGTFDDQGNLTGHNDGRHFQPREIFRFDAPHEGLLNFGKTEILNAWRLGRAYSKATENPVPSIDLHQTGGKELSQNEISQLVATWARARRNRRTGGVGFTNAGIEARTLGQHPEQLLVEGRKAAALDLCDLIGAPDWVANISISGSSLTYSNVGTRSREALDYFVMPYLDAIAGRISQNDLTRRGQWARFNTVEILRGDFKERMDAYKKALETGIYTLEELRQMERGELLP